LAVTAIGLSPSQNGVFYKVSGAVYYSGYRVSGTGQNIIKFMIGELMERDKGVNTYTGSGIASK
jgi:hypothetical protein